MQKVLAIVEPTKLKQTGFRFIGMITSLVVALVIVSIISFLMFGESDQELVYAQTQGTDFTQLFSSEEFRAADCSNPVLCPPAIKVLYQDPTGLNVWLCGCYLERSSSSTEGRVSD